MCPHVNGFAFNTSEYIGWNFRAESINEKVTPYLEVKAQMFKSFKYVGFATNIYLFAGLNKNTKIGSSLRGAADYQKFNTSEPIDANNYALETPGVLVINFDIPVHIITTNWLKWGKAMFGSYADLSPKMQKVFKLPHKLFSVLDFELQLSPFVDIGFIQNRATNHFFYYKEGIYTTGIEMLVYPVKWRNYVVRASIGIDAGKKWLDDALGLESNYRTSAKNWEAYFGLGTQF